MEINPILPMVPVSLVIPAPVLEVAKLFRAAMVNLWIGDSIAHSSEGHIKYEEYENGSYRFLSIERDAIAQNMKSFPTIKHDTKFCFSTRIDMHNIKTATIHTEGKFTSIVFRVSEMVYFEIILIQGS